MGCNSEKGVVVGFNILFKAGRATGFPNHFEYRRPKPYLNIRLVCLVVLFLI